MAQDTRRRDSVNRDIIHISDAGARRLTDLPETTPVHGRRGRKPESREGLGELRKLPKLLHQGRLRRVETEGAGIDAWESASHRMVARKARGTRDGVSWGRHGRLGHCEGSSFRGGPGSRVGTRLAERRGRGASRSVPVPGKGKELMQLRLPCTL